MPVNFPPSRRIRWLGDLAKVPNAPCCSPAVRACPTPVSGGHGEKRAGLDEDVVKEYYRLSKKRNYPLEELVPLVELKEGMKGVVAFAFGGPGLIRRLCDLGLTPDTEIKVVKKGPLGGPIILEVRSCELAIGRGIASKVLVKPL